MSHKYINIVKGNYMETQTNLRTCGAKNGCLIIISVHQASSLSFLDEITIHISVNIL